MTELTETRDGKNILNNLIVSCDILASFPEVSPHQFKVSLAQRSFVITKFLKHRGLTCVRNIFQFASPNTYKVLIHFILERFGFWHFFLNFLHSLVPD